MKPATAHDPSRDEAVRHSAGFWEVLWFFVHLAVVYGIAIYLTPWVAAWTRGTLLPLLRQPTSSGRFEFFFSHILAFSFIPALLAGFANARFKNKAAEFVFLVPVVILAYKFVTFPAPSLFQSQFVAAFHQYFGGGFAIPEFRDWHEFWTIMGSNSEMMRGVTQAHFTAPFYSGVGYSLAVWIARRTDLNRKIAEALKNYERSRFEHQP